VAAAAAADAKTACIPTLQLESYIGALFCPGKAECCKEWHIKCGRTSARLRLGQLEHGVCQQCGVDARAMYLRAAVHPAGSAERRNAMFCTPQPEHPLRLCEHLLDGRWPGGRTRMHWTKLHGKCGEVDDLDKLLAKLGGSPAAPPLREGDFWDADHKLACANGGGEAGLDDYQTLCKPCHKVKTREDLDKARILKSFIGTSKRPASEPSTSKPPTSKSATRRAESAKLPSGYPPPGCPTGYCVHGCGRQLAPSDVPAHDRICPQLAIIKLGVREAAAREADRDGQSRKRAASKVKPPDRNSTSDVDVRTHEGA
jgi:hypothetical protein